MECLRILKLRLWSLMEVSGSILMFQGGHFQGFYIYRFCFSINDQYAVLFSMGAFFCVGISDCQDFSHVGILVFRDFGPAGFWLVKIFAASGLSIVGILGFWYFDCVGILGYRDFDRVVILSVGIVSGWIASSKCIMISSFTNATYRQFIVFVTHLT